MDEDFYAKLNADGVAKVKANLETHVYSSRQKPLAIEWLARSNEANSAEQLALARRAALAAETANSRANIAITIAIISLMTTIVIAVIPFLFKLL